MRCCDFKTGTKWPEKNEDSIDQNQRFSQTIVNMQYVTRNYKHPFFTVSAKNRFLHFQGAGRRKQGGGSREEGVGRREGGSIRFPIMDVPL